MKSTMFNNKPKLIIILIMIAAFTISVRLLITFNSYSSALLYIGIPFLISLVLIIIRNPNEPTSWQKQYLNRVIDAFIIMLASSIILFEGFICVIMFMPIYLIVILLMFTFRAYIEYARKKGKGTTGVHVLPVLLLFSSFEGISPEFSFNRNEQVIVSRVVEASINDINRNLVEPMQLQTERPWFLNLFPMPDYITAGSLSQGDVHEIHFKYYRWFFTNLHEGRMLLEMSVVENNRIKTTFLEDSSYIANYLELKGTEIKLDQIDLNHTRVTLTINYNRLLDPYWYFSPIERYGISKTADFLITEVIAREHS